METKDENRAIIPEVDMLSASEIVKSFMPSMAVQGFGGFRMVSLERGVKLQNCIRSANHIILMVDGTAKFSSKGRPGYLEAEDMFLIPYETDFELTGDRSCKLIHFAFYALPQHIHAYLKKVYGQHPYCSNASNEILMQNEIVRGFVGMLRVILGQSDHEVMTERYANLKAYELFHLMIATYENSRIVPFFSGLLERKSDFRDFLFENCDKVKTVDELISLSGFSRTNFYRRFNREMNMPVHHWMQLQKAEAVREAAGEPLVSVQQLRERFSFASPGNFVRFCRIYFGCTPFELIRFRRSGHAVPVLG